MPGNLLDFLPEIDLFSFILGLILGGVLWAILSKIISDARKDKVNKVSKVTKKEKIGLKTSAQILDKLNNNTLRFAQANHLAGFLFPLAEVYVTSKLVYPYPYQDPAMDQADAYESSQALPFIPDHPEFHENIPLPAITLISALTKQNLIAIQGDIGSGKTTLLSAAVSAIIERSGDGLQFDGYLPLFFHYSEIDIKKDENNDPIFKLLKTFQLTELRQSEMSISNLLSTSSESGKLILFVDGLDELDPLSFKQYAEWIHELVKQYHQIRVAITCNRFYSPALDLAGFNKYFISPLNIAMRLELKENFRKAIFKSNVRDSFLDSTVEEIDSLWENQKNQPSNFFFTTLSLLNDYSFSGTSGSELSLLHSHLTRICNNQEEYERLRRLSEELFIRSDHLLDRSGLNNILRNRSIQESVNEVDLTANENIQKDESLLEKLLRTRILTERRPNQFGFQSLLFFGYLLGESYNRKTDSDWKYYYNNPLEEIALRFNPQSDYIFSWTQALDMPLHRNISLLSKHFFKLNKDHAELNRIAPIVLSGLANNELPFSSRLLFLSLLVYLDSQFTIKVFEFLLASKSALNKQISSIGLGFQRSTESIALLRSALSSSTVLEKIFCSLSFFRLWDSASRKFVMDHLSSGDDYLRRIICELYSIRLPDGKDLLLDVSVNGSIAMRKASIFGLKLLSGQDIEDHITRRIAEEKEWIVRDAAVRALEEMNTGKLLLQNAPPPPPAKIEWLLEFASKNALGISPNSVPYDVLFEVVRNGNDLEKVAALNLIKNNSSAKAIDFLRTLSQNHDYIGDRAYFYLSELLRNEILT